MASEVAPGAEGKGQAHGADGQGERGREQSQRVLGEACCEEGWLLKTVVGHQGLEQGQ